MKKIFFVLLFLVALFAGAQNKTVLPNMPDVEAMKKMTPAELEAYKKKLIDQSSKQIKTIADQNNFKVNEILLPDFKVEPPPRDFKRLALLPKQPPTLIQLADGLRQSKKQLESVTPKAILEEVKKITEVQTPAQQQNSSVAAFYADKPAEALLISMNSALQNLQEVTSWNNLAAIFNMTSLEHKAIPILMNQLAKYPNNSMLLNNMGQAYMGLGDLVNAEEFLKRCLAEDELHPEANHSMGMLKFFKKEYEAGMKYFEKELEIAHRRSTLALIKKNGGKINLYNIRKKRNGVPQKNYFEEINLGKFKIPDFPYRMEDTRKIKQDNEDFAQSVYEEMMFWINIASDPMIKEAMEEGKQRPGLYHDVVKVMLEDLDGLFPPKNLSLFTDSDINYLKDLMESYGTKMRELKCEEVPVGSNVPGIHAAYQQKCCDKKRPLINEFLSDYNSFVANRIAAVQPRWKDYINGLISVVSLNPNSANKKAVYYAVHGYFSFLSFAWGSGQFIEPPSDCKNDLTSEQVDAIIQSSRTVNINCPSWLNLELDLLVAKLKADCSKYGVEIGKGLQASYEKDFKTGKSTISAGVGASAKFWHLGKASAKQMLYISYDDNNEFADFGLKGAVGVGMGLESERLVVDNIGKISGVIAGVDVEYLLGISSGFKGAIKGKGVLAPYIKLETPK